VYIGETILKELPQYTQPLLEDFKAFLIGAGRAESTTDSYFHDAVRYLQFLAKTDPDLQLINFKKVTMKAFVYELTMEGIQKSTIQRRLMGVLAFWEYLNDMEMAEKPLKLKASRSISSQAPIQLSRYLTTISSAISKDYMMNLQQSNNFTYSRQLAATLLIRQAGISIQAALQLRRADVQNEVYRVVVGEIILQPVPFELIAYLELHDALFPECPYLFPTIKGDILLPSKFNKAQRQCLVKASVEDTPTHPNKLNESQLTGLEALRFNMERPGYQRTLAVALSIHLALRPSEVAKLQKKDFDFDDRKIRLRATKSQEDQDLPLLDDLRTPLRRYLAHLPNDEDYLFINSAGNPWDRRDVHAVVRQRGVQKGLTTLVTPRRLRPTVVKQLIRRGMKTPMIVQLLRHSDERTLHTNYIDTLLDELGEEMNANYHPLQEAN
jgi:integrase